MDKAGSHSCLSLPAGASFVRRGKKTHPGMYNLNRESEEQRSNGFKLGLPIFASEAEVGTCLQDEMLG